MKEIVKNPWLILVLQIICAYLQFGFLFGGGGGGLKDYEIHIILVGLLLSIYPFFLSISKLIKEGKNTKIGYIILIIPSLLIGYVTFLFLKSVL